MKALLNYQQIPLITSLSTLGSKALFDKCVLQVKGGPEGLYEGCVAPRVVSLYWKRLSGLGRLCWIALSFNLIRCVKITSRICDMNLIC